MGAWLANGLLIEDCLAWLKRRSPTSGSVAALVNTGLICQQESSELMLTLGIAPAAWKDCTDDKVFVVSSDPQNSCRKPSPMELTCKPAPGRQLAG